MANRRWRRSANASRTSLEEVRGPRRVALVATLDDARERRDGEDELEELSLRRRARGRVSLVSRAGREGGRAKGLLVGFA